MHNKDAAELWYETTHDPYSTHHVVTYAAIANLRYGSIVVNGPTTMGFAFTKLTRATRHRAIAVDF